MPAENAVRLVELSQEVRAEYDALLNARAALVAIVMAKRKGESNPDVWMIADEIVDGLIQAQASTGAVDACRCAECSAILHIPASVPVASAPLAIVCGPLHVLTFDEGTLTLGALGDEPQWEPSQEIDVLSFSERREPSTRVTQSEFADNAADIISKAERGPVIVTDELGAPRQVIHCPRNVLSTADTDEAARAELRFICTYLGHNDQDANHAWMVRRIRAVLAHKDPSTVEAWNEADGVRPPREPKITMVPVPGLSAGQFYLLTPALQKEMEQRAADYLADFEAALRSTPLIKK